MKVTVKVVLPPGGSDESIPPVSNVKSVGFAPVLLSAIPMRFALPVLRMVKDLAVLVVLTVWSPKPAGSRAFFNAIEWFQPAEMLVTPDCAVEGMVV